jgi:adenylate cyclase
VANRRFPTFNDTTQHKIASALVATAIFACLGGITTLAAGRPLELGLANAVLIGIGVGLFEEFYVQSAARSAYDEPLCRFVQKSHRGHG